MSMRWIGLGPAVALTVAAGALAGCDQNNQTSADLHREPPPNDHKVEKRVEGASRDLARGATAVVEGVKKGVNEGVQQGKRDAHSDGDHADRPADRSQDSDASRRPSNQ